MNDERDDAEQLGPHLSDELKRFAQDLSSLRPSDDRLDRERLAFLAGQASMTAGNIQSLSHSSSWRRHQAWPAAFATMSMVAATLLFMLVMRPAVNELPSGARDVATQDHMRTSPQMATHGTSQRSADVLVARDALGGDIEQRLTTLSKVKSGASFSVERPDSPRLTPAAWRRVDDGATSKIPSPGSSGLPVFWKVNT
jgi:hypothetical protein